MGDVEQKNYNCIDLVKFVCAVMVVMIHIRPFGVSKEPLILFLNYLVQDAFTRIAVPLFFVFSGFFLFRKTSLEQFSTEPVKRYLLRIARLYLIWTVIYFPLSCRSFFADPRGLAHAVKIYLRNCVFAGSYSQLWYLTALIFAVALISFLLVKRIEPKKIVILALAFYLIGLLGQSWFGLIRPLKELSPASWQALRLVRKVIVTTRDGLFDGFLFVGLGMLFAFYEFELPKRTALIGFSVSMLLMVLEALSLKVLGFVLERDMYLFLVPAAFFGFSLFRQIRLPDRPVYKLLRELSALIFLSHLWVKFFVEKALSLLGRRLSTSPLLFLCTLSVSVLASWLIVRLSALPKLKWLKRLYT